METTQTSGRFRKTVEDFICENCGAEVAGNGYTDHCHKCLFSKHVDVMPGDRAESCKGLMKPVHSAYKDNCYRIYYICLKCGKERKFKSASNDNEELLLALLK